MNYQETLQYLYNHLPMFSRVGAIAYKKDIHNTIALCERLNNPQNNFKSIHIAGTNGKGSMSHMLAAILQTQGYKVGLYTSPHIKDFGERIKINGKMIDEQFVIDFTEKTKDICNDIKPSFFELTVAMAFEYFSNEQVDIAVIETGLGGRLDSTNIINPILSLITNIGLDHTQLLGNTIEEIAFEKAGIIKSNTPCIIGETLPSTLPVFEKKASEMNAPLLVANDYYECTNWEKNQQHLSCLLLNKKLNQTEKFSIDLTGNYQIKNLISVLTACNLLNEMGIEIKNSAIQYALFNSKKITGLRGRWDLISEDPAVIYDVAHNKDGIYSVLKQLNQEYPFSHYHFIIGFVKDKDINSVLECLPQKATYYFTNAQIERALSCTDLKQMAAHKQLIGESFDDVNNAIIEAKRNASQKDVIVVLGSFFVLAEIDNF